MFYFSVFLFFTTLLSHCQGDKNYCEIDENHTMCIYKGLGEACISPGDFGVSPFERELILKTHNELRRYVAKGYETRGINGPQPQAANMKKLTWDDELAAIAQRWADQCLFRHDVRDVSRWRVGQNIYWKLKYPVHEVNWTEAIQSWYNEVDLFDGNGVEVFRFDPQIGHYSQLVWHNTEKIGCGRRDYGPNKMYVCNYGPAGNYINEPLYTIGEPCSKCGVDKCFDGLCVKKQTGQHNYKTKTAELDNETELTQNNSTASEKELQIRAGEEKEVLPKPTEEKVLPKQEENKELHPKQSETKEQPKESDKKEFHLTTGKPDKKMKVFLILYYNNKSYVKPVSYLDILLQYDEKDGIDENKTSNGIDDKYTLDDDTKKELHSLKNKIELLHKMYNLQ